MDHNCYNTFYFMAEGDPERKKRMEWAGRNYKDKNPGSRQSMTYSRLYNMEGEGVIRFCICKAMKPNTIHSETIRIRGGREDVEEDRGGKVPWLKYDLNSSYTFMLLTKSQTMAEEITASARRRIQNKKGISSDSHWTENKGSSMKS